LHVFKSGPQTSANGVERHFSREDLQEVVDSYDPDVHEAPLVIGHSGDSDGIPSYGWIKGFERRGDDLYADVDFTDTAKDLVKNGHYKKVSISFYSPESGINPHKGQWSARHLALLGAAPPAVKGLEPFSFSEEEGVFNFATNLTPDQLFDKELGPSLVADKGPLETLREKLELIRGDISSSLSELKENQETQQETDVSPEETIPEADSSAPENPYQNFLEMKKKMGREGSEASESAQTTANMETMLPDDQYEERTERKTAKGAHGHEVQVVEEVFEEVPAEPKPKAKSHKLRAKSKPKKKVESEMDMDMEQEDGEFSEDDIDNLVDSLLSQLDEIEDEFSERVSHKTVEGGKVKFGTHEPERMEDVAGRGLTGRSKDDSFGDRQKIGKGESDGRTNVSKDSGRQDQDRKNTARNSEEEVSRASIGRDTEDGGDEEARWADQPEARMRATNSDQYNVGNEGFARDAGTSEGKEPHGRDGGPTEVSEDMEEEPHDEDIAVPLESTKGNKVARVIHQSSGDERAPVKGGPIGDFAEGDADGLTDTPRKAKVSDGTDPRGRDDGPTEFPDRSEEDPDTMELAVDLENATESDKVRIIRQRSGEEASLEHKERVKDTLSKTGKGSTYGQRSPVMEEEEEGEEEGEDFSEEDIEALVDSVMAQIAEEEEFSETEEFCGMGSMSQAKPVGYPEAMFEELKSLKAENDKLRREYEEHKIRARKEKIAEFIDSLYVEGKLTDGIIPQRELQNYCEGLEFGTLNFSEGETPTSRLFEMLRRLPNMVYFGEVVSEASIPEEPEEMDPHEKALKMVANGEAADYVEAIKICLWNNGNK